MMNSQTSFSLNPNPNPTISESGLGGVNEGYFWESHLWPFGNFENSGTTGADVGSGDMLGKEETEGAVAEVVLVVNEERKEVTNGGSKGKRKGETDLETHIFTERERRKKMRNMFSNLHAMLPQLPPKTDKTTIVDEAVKHIKTLEIQLQRLQQVKANKVRCATNASINYEPLSSSGPHLKIAGQSSSRESFLAEHGGASLKPLVKMNMADSGSHNIMFHTWTSPNVVLNTFGQEAQIMICSPIKLGLFTSVVIALEKHMIEVESANVSSQGNGSFYMIHVRLASGAIEQCPDTFSAEGVFKQAVSDLMLMFPSK